MAPSCTLPAGALAFLLALAPAAAAMPERAPVNARPAAPPPPAHEIVVTRPDGFAWVEVLVSVGITAMLCCLVAAIVLRRHEARISHRVT